MVYESIGPSQLYNAYISFLALLDSCHICINQVLFPYFFHKKTSRFWEAFAFSYIAKSYTKKPPFLEVIIVIIISVLSVNMTFILIKLDSPVNLAI